MKFKKIIAQIKYLGAKQHSPYINKTKVRRPQLQSVCIHARTDRGISRTISPAEVQLKLEIRSVLGRAGPCRLRTFPSFKNGEFGPNELRGANIGASV